MKRPTKEQYSKAAAALIATDDDVVVNKDAKVKRVNDEIEHGAWVEPTDEPIKPTEYAKIGET